MSRYLQKRETPAAGSLAQAIQQGTNELVALGNVKVIVCADHSASTSECDAEGGRSRHQVIYQMLLDLQAKYPMQVLLIQFASRCEVKLDGLLDEPQGGTAGTPPLQQAEQLANETTEVWFLSDGELSEASFFGGSSLGEIDRIVKALGKRIHFGFAGAKGGEGESTLRRLAQLANTQFNTQIHKNMGDFTQKVEDTLLLAATNSRT